MTDYLSRCSTFKSWPHTLPRSDSLASTGFKHVPTADSLDHVQCIKCSLSLRDWKPNDDPAVKHWLKSPDYHLAKLTVPTLFKEAYLKSTTQPASPSATTAAAEISLLANQSTIKSSKSEASQPV